MACTVCKKQYVPSNNSSYDSDEKPHVCVTCGKSFSLKVQLKKHMEAHGDGKPYVCYACEKKNSSSYNLRLSEKGNFSCDTCNETFETKRMLLQHNSSQHSIIDWDDCDENYDSPDDQKRHSFVHKSTRAPVKKPRAAKNYHCTECNKSYTHLQALNKHSLTHTENECRYCRTKFSSQNDLHNHQENECVSKKTAIDKEIKSGKKYTCLLCQKSFTRKSALEGHIAVHVNVANDKSESTAEEEDDEEISFPSKASSEKRITDNSVSQQFDPEQENKNENKTAESNENNLPKVKLRQTYPCSDCKKVYTSESRLEKHKLTHRKSKAFHPHKKYRCRICREPFLSKEEYKKHKSSHGPDEKPAKRIKTYMCEICLRNFDKKKLLKKHMKSHLSKSQDEPIQNKNSRKRGKKIKPFACRICGKLFAGVITLKKHELNHQNKSAVSPSSKKSRWPETFKCPYCEKDIPSRNFTRHKLTHTPEVCGICDERFEDRDGLKEHLKTHIGTEAARKFLECSSKLAKNNAKSDQPEGKVEYIYLVLR